MRNAPVFKCSGYCMFSDCPVDVLKNESTLKAQVSFRGGMVVHSKRELQRRPARADMQPEIHKKLQAMPPRAM